MKTEIGSKYGRMKVVKEVERTDARVRRVECLCECGTTKTVSLYKLRSGKTKSCGCLRSEMMKKKQTTHGLSKHPLRFVLNSMIQRCTNPKQPAYKNYGERGITVCHEWRNSPKVFIEWAEQNGYEQGLTIERIDVDGSYCPENCVFIIPKEQQSNTTRSVKITYRGKTQTVAEWSRETGIKYSTIYHRLKSGWPINKIFQKKLEKGGGSFHKQKG